MNWNSFKASILDARPGSLPICDGIEINGTCDEAVKTHDPHQISVHIKKVQELLQSCLSLRNDTRELEVIAVKVESEFTLEQKTSALDEAIEIDKLKRSTVSSELAVYSSVQNIPNNLDAAQYLLEGRRVRLESESASLNEIETNIRARWSALNNHRAAYHARHSEPGNAHNYVERAEKIGLVYAHEARSLLLRAHALRKGLDSIYGLMLPELPNKIVASDLDSLVIWVLEAVSQLERKKESEVQYDVVVPLVQPYGSGSSLVSAEQFRASMTNPGPLVLEFEIPKEVFLSEDVRTLAFGIAFGSKFSLVAESGIDRTQTADSFARLAIVAIAPPDDLGMRRRFPFGNVGPHAAQQPVAYFSGATVENLSPVGHWRLEISPRMIWKDGSEVMTSDGVLGERIKDLKITFRVYSPSRN